MALVPVPPRILSTRFLPAIDAALGASLGIDADRTPSAAFVTCDQDHSLYVALDEATKHAPIEIAYARSLYAGARHAPGPLSGEVLGVLVGPDPDCVAEGLAACVRCLEHETRYYELQMSRAGHLVFPHVVSQLGEYLSARAGLAPGDSLAYLMAPPLEALIALDAAVKAADVRLVKTFAPPTETNFAGGFLSGSLHECLAAAEAFLETVADVAIDPLRRF
jgi:ethanolamine utilization protein EutL